MNGRLGCAAAHAHKSETRKPRTLVEQVLGPKIGKPEILPPQRFLFAPMPIERVREKPARVLFGRPFRDVSRNVARQPLNQRVDLLQPFTERFARRTFRCFRPGNSSAGIDQRGSPRFQPIPQPPCRYAVIAVVTGDDAAIGLVDEFDISELKAGLYFGERHVRIG